MRKWGVIFSKGASPCSKVVDSPQKVFVYSLKVYPAQLSKLANRSVLLLCNMDGRLIATTNRLCFYSNVFCAPKIVYSAPKAEKLCFQQ